MLFFPVYIINYPIHHFSKYSYHSFRDRTKVKETSVRPEELEPLAGRAGRPAGRPFEEEDDDDSDTRPPPSKRAAVSSTMT